MELTNSDKQQLDEAGYVTFPNAIPAGFLDQLHQRVEQLFQEEGASAGAEFKQEPGCRRLANLADKGEIFHQAVLWPKLLEAVAHVIGPDFKLSSLNARSVDPYSEVRQPLHADMGAIPDEHGNWVCNSVWMLDPFTKENGAIRLIPGSHRWRSLPQEKMADPMNPHPQEILLTGERGTAVIMNAHLWHAGTPNQTAHPRTALHVFFVRGDKPQQQFQKNLVRSEVQAQLSPQLRKILALDDERNDVLCSQDIARSGFLKLSSNSVVKEYTLRTKFSERGRGSFLQNFFALCFQWEVSGCYYRARGSCSVWLLLGFSR